MKFGVLTVSDRAASGDREDISGRALINKLEGMGWEVNEYHIVADDLARIQEKIISWCECDINVLLTTGGTGFSPRDLTPEATRPLLDREAPGIAEAMRLRSLEKTTHAMLSRGVAGIRGSVIVVNLPGNPIAAIENLDVIAPVLQHAVDLLMESPNAEAGHRPQKSTSF